ncbi:hypothetical protein JCM13369A_20700 [Mediterraneibacter glycyrrhizinilyticus JCM 13369]
MYSTLIVFSFYACMATEKGRELLLTVTVAYRRGTVFFRTGSLKERKERWL